MCLSRLVSAADFVQLSFGTPHVSRMGHADGDGKVIGGEGIHPTPPARSAEANVKSIADGLRSERSRMRVEDPSLMITKQLSLICEVRAAEELSQPRSQHLSRTLKSPITTQPPFPPSPDSHSKLAQGVGV